MRDRRWCWALGFLLAACGGGSSGGGLGPGGNAPFSATIDGQAWTADATSFSVVGGNAVPGALTITGADIVGPTNYRALTLTMSFIGAVGTYPIGINIGTTPGATATVLDVSGATQLTYTTPFSGAAGTLTVATLTATRMTGTFAFTAPPSSGPGASTTVTSGSFDIALPAGFTSVPTGNHGSTVSATLGATPFNGATVIGLGDLSLGAFNLGGQTVTTSLTIATATPITAPGSFTVGSGVTLSVLDLSSGHSWNSAAGATGTVTFTSVGNGRVAGTFDAVLVPVGGASGTLTVAGGSFDVLVNTP